MGNCSRPGAAQDEQLARGDHRPREFNLHRHRSAKFHVGVPVIECGFISEAFVSDR